jgi:hypothetical protein
MWLTTKRSVLTLVYMAAGAAAGNPPYLRWRCLRAQRRQSWFAAPESRRRTRRNRRLILWRDVGVALAQATASSPATTRAWRSQRPRATTAFNGSMALYCLTAPRPRPPSPYRRRVLDAAFVPQLVEPAGDGERRLCAEVALEHLPVIADSPDDVRRPCVGEPDLLAEIS